MNVQRYRPKPRARRDDDQIAARYEYGTDLAPLLTVARMADEDAAMQEVLFGEATWVLLVRWLQVHDDRPATIDYEVVETGKWLAYSPSGFLYAASEGNWRQWYDLVPEPW